jgi:hypothetical protein
LHTDDIDDFIPKTPLRATSSTVLSTGSAGPVLWAICMGFGAMAFKFSAAGPVVVSLSIAVLPGRAEANDALRGPWVTKPGAVICENYFAVNDGEAAVHIGEWKWLAELHCRTSPETIPVRAILSGSRPSEPSDIWRVRLVGPAGDFTAHLRGRSVVKRLSNGGWQTYSCAHGGWRCDIDTSRSSAVTSPPSGGAAAFDKLLKTLEEQKPEPGAFDNALKNLTKPPTDGRGRPPGPRGTGAPSQPKASLGGQLTASDLDALKERLMQQLTPCWIVPAGVRDAKDLSVQIRAAVNPDGTVSQAVILNQGGLSDPLFRAAAESASHVLRPAMHAAAPAQGKIRGLEGHRRQF